MAIWCLDTDRQQKSWDNNGDLMYIPFQVILAVGNYVNSSRRGFALGFKLDALSKVSCIRYHFMPSSSSAVDPPYEGLAARRSPLYWILIFGHSCWVDVVISMPVYSSVHRLHCRPRLLLVHSWITFFSRPLYFLQRNHNIPFLTTSSFSEVLFWQL